MNRFETGYRFYLHGYYLFNQEVYPPLPDDVPTIVNGHCNFPCIGDIRPVHLDGKRPLIDQLLKPASQLGVNPNGRTNDIRCELLVFHDVFLCMQY